MIVPPLAPRRVAARPQLAINIGVAAALAAWWMIELTGNLPRGRSALLCRLFVGEHAARRGPATFRLIWGTSNFISVTIGYGLVALAAYARFLVGALRRVVLGLPKQRRLDLGANGAQRVYRGHHRRSRRRCAARHPAGRIWMILFGVIAPIAPIWIAVPPTARRCSIR